MSYLRITQMRSAIGLPERTHRVLVSLGLGRKRLQTRYHKVSPEIAGMVLKVKELVRVEHVDRALSRQEERQLRRPIKGYEVIGSKLS